MYWIMEKSDGSGDIVLCEHHALEATNMAMALTGDAPFGSMAEACSILTALLAIAGQELGMSSSDHGSCMECAYEQESA